MNEIGNVEGYYLFLEELKVDNLCGETEVTFALLKCREEVYSYVDFCECVDVEILEKSIYIMMYDYLTMDNNQEENNDNYKQTSFNYLNNRNMISA